MYTLVGSMPVRQLVTQQMPVLLISMLIAELFYKFHSFTAEAIAFLATWYAMDAVVQRLTRVISRHRDGAPSDSWKR